MLKPTFWPWKPDDDCDDEWPHKIIYVKFGMDSTEPVAVQERPLPSSDLVIQNGSIRKWLSEFLDDCEEEEEGMFDTVFEQDGRVIFVAFTNNETDHLVRQMSLQLEKLRAQEDKTPPVFVSVASSKVPRTNMMQLDMNPDFDPVVSAMFTLRQAVEKLKREKELADPCDQDFENDATYFDEPVDCDRFIYVSWGNTTINQISTSLENRSLISNSTGIVTEQIYDNGVKGYLRSSSDLLFYVLTVCSSLVFI